MPFKVSPKTLDVDTANLSDSSLFELMADHDANPSRATRAWNEFYQRYSTYLWNCCLHVCRTTTEGDKLAKDIFQSSIQKIYAHARKYDPQKANGVKAWISKIAYHEFIDYYNKYHHNFIAFDQQSHETEVGEDVWGEGEEETVASKILGLKLEQLNSLLSKLNPKEFKVLMTYMSHFQLDKPNSHLPDSQMKQLCIEFNVKSDAIRQIKRRALAKLKRWAREINT